MKTPRVPVVAGLVIFLTSLAAYVVLSILHLDTNGLIAFAGIAAGLGGFASWQNTEAIKQQTNGPLTRMMEQMDNLVGRVEKLEGVKAIAEEISVKLDDARDREGN